MHRLACARAHWTPPLWLASYDLFGISLGAETVVSVPENGLAVGMPPHEPEEATLRSPPSTVLVVDQQPVPDSA